MLIPCPFCGERDVHEFTYLGDATAKRPDPTEANAEQQFFEYVYLRDNPAGRHEDLWYHTQGCRSWLKLARNTRTHDIETASLARETRR